jgi:hypothetical protein
MFAAQPVPVPDAAGLAVGGAVGLDREHHSAWVLRVSDREVNAVAANAVLRHDGDPGSGQPAPDVGLERVEVVTTGGLRSTPA